ncbi:glycosyl transferase family 2 [Pseudoalteromonas phenolica]|uniref:glycosyltransferase family 2 protein n=1 Tax=Pseudoalteromonas phenolica TaxID=161398 RepID=UPI00110A5CA2|nr:glycosyltransferase family 2 protein [Pseudoalteromonas phenolica]TMN92353.1 glycosyl transferase family 2 [Pseudoalteromonas phenolica]
MSKISIITATFNSQDTILETYNSLCAQTFSEWEWLVTDDCSTDSTWSILKKIAANDSRVSLCRNENNSGAAITRNNSLSRINGGYVAFIDSDDIWLPEKLQEQLLFMESNKNVNFSYTAYELIDEDGNSLNRFVDLKTPESVNYKDMLMKKATLGCSTVMLRSSTFKDLVMPNYRTGQDYAFWLKLLKCNQNAYLLRRVLTQYRILPNSISRNKLGKAKRQWQIYTECEGISLIESCWYFLNYAFRALFRK